MGKKGLIWTIIGWFFYWIIEYYYGIFFFSFLIWFGLLFSLLVVFVIQLGKLMNEWKCVTKLRVTKVVVFALLFSCTLLKLQINDFIERIDWKIFYNKRMEIVAQVKNKELTPNVSWNGTTCELPFEFPVVSNGGNDISIERNEKDNSLTINFYIFRNFFESPSSYFIYTNDEQRKKELEILIRRDPKNNWKIDNNWYRAYYDAYVQY